MQHWPLNRKPDNKFSLRLRCLFHLQICNQPQNEEEEKVDGDGATEIT